MHSIFEEAITIGHYTGENPVKRVHRYKLTKKTPEFHTEEELNTLLEASKAHGVEWVVLLGGWAGLRKAEIVNARWEWFEFDSDKSLIQVKASHGPTIKDSEECAIPMNRLIHEALLPHRRPEGYLFEAKRHSAGFHRYRYEPKKSLAASLEDAGLTTKNPYQRLRMTFGSIHVQRGTPKTSATLTRVMPFSTAATALRRICSCVAGLSFRASVFMARSIRQPVNECNINYVRISKLV